VESTYGGSGSGGGLSLLAGSGGGSAGAITLLQPAQQQQQSSGSGDGTVSNAAGTRQGAHQPQHTSALIMVMPCIAAARN
jgi:hypothetical protein